MAELRKETLKLGLEKILGNDRKLLKNMRVGLICNPASVDRRFAHAADLFFQNSDINLTALFGPQHGIRGDVQDNMIETRHAVDKKTGLPIYSLYSETRQPTEAMLENLDALVFDLQDVGCRVYTFIYTMANAMKACARFGKKMFVLDRPNPINGVSVEGNTLEATHESFVGQYPIPMRHGLTVGELAGFFNREFDINCDLSVVEMDNWRREQYYDETGLSWVAPSPNMPTVDTAVVFPGTVYIEGTEMSEGRGTTRPFETVGAPYIDAEELAAALKSLDLPGVIFRPIHFLPTFQKHAGVDCGGVFLHVTDRQIFAPVSTGLAIIKTVFDLYGDDFAWKQNPYEYAFDRNPFDVIDGSFQTRRFIEQKTDIGELKKSWDAGLDNFIKKRSEYLLY